MDEPTSCFTISSDTIFEGVPVQFKNCSKLASYYHWDFGDGTYSSEEEPIHTFKYEAYSQGVKLVAINENGNEHHSYISIDVLDYYPTKMKVHSLSIYYPSSQNSFTFFDTHDGSGPDFTFYINQGSQYIYDCPYNFDDCQYDTPYTFDSQHGLPFELDLTRSTFTLLILDKDGSHSSDLVEQMHYNSSFAGNQYPNNIVTLTGDRVTITMEVTWTF